MPTVADQNAQLILDAEARKNASPLASMRRGDVGVVVEVCGGGDDGVLLESMGLRPNARVRVCRTGRTCVVIAEGADRCGCRLGIERRLAQRVLVAPGPA